MLKRLIKVVITPLLSQLQGWLGWQKNGTMLRYLHLVVFCAKIEPKIEKIRKTIKKQAFFEDANFYSLHWDFLIASVYQCPLYGQNKKNPCFLHLVKQKMTHNF